MSLIDTSGMLLEGVRVSSGNNLFSFPPRNYVLPENNDTFQATTSRAEYVILADSLLAGEQEIEIGNPDLIFRWTKNEPGVNRFDWDGFNRRWMPSPGGPPDNVGIIGNNPRLVAAVPDPTIATAPFSFYVGTPVRLVTFDVHVVNHESDFTNPSSLTAGKLQIAKDTGSLNFSASDLATYSGQTVYGQRQNFFDRTQRKGSIGQLPLSSASSYFLFLNPLPAPGQTPRIRIGYGPLLQAIEVPNEGSLGTPAPGTFTWSLDTGRVKFSDFDINSNLEATVYYDGVIMDSFQLDRTNVGPITTSFPTPQFFIPGLVGLTTDENSRYVVFAELVGQLRNYFPMSLFDSSVSTPDDEPSSGTVFGDVSTGAVYFSSDDIGNYLGWTISYVHAAQIVERGVSFQVYRSGINGSGEEAVKDFVILYSVVDQVIVDGIGAGPFVMLPTTPIVDSTLQFFILPGPGSTGTLSGELRDGTDPTKQGYGYLLDLDSHQFKFCFRKTVDIVLAKDSPVVKLAEGAITKQGFEVSLNGHPIIPGVDFNFDEDTGLLEFIEPIGEDDPKNILGIVGTVHLPDTFVSDSPVFTPSHIGKFLLFPAGGNSGIYKILTVDTPRQVTVSPNLSNAGPDSVDLRQDREIVADRFWTDFKPKMKKFTLYKADSPAGPYTLMDESEYSILASVGQVNLTNPAKAGQSFEAHYIFLSSTDNINFTPIPKVEKAIFKIRQENGVVTTGSTKVTFNPDGDIVSLDRPIQVAINGFTQKSTDFTFVPPGTINLTNPSKAGDSVVLDYWVQNAPGGNGMFNLIFAPIDQDPPVITKGSTQASFNGDQTSTVSPGSAFLLSDKDVVIAKLVTYNSSTDTTEVVFENAAIADSGSSPILVCEPINGDYRVHETAPSDSFTKGTNSITLTGDLPYRIGTVITVDGDPYYVLSVLKDTKANTTKITLASAAVRNYIIPNITRTVRPVLKTDGKFQTDKPLDVDFPVTLIRMGPNRAVLANNVDYTVAEGGLIKLSTDAVFGDSLQVLYVARVSKPAGSVFHLNYSHAIAPSDSNGILTQQLVASYTLYAPDSFFYRIESFNTFLPEVQALLQQSAQAGGSSGPDTASRSSMKAKDFGNPSLFFPEQHYSNIDLVAIRLLKWYNDLTNAWEDLLANLDGRVVGGTDGRFRFDGNTANPPRADLTQVTNDIDDQIKLFDFFELVDFFDFELAPFYGYMGGINRFGRFFRTLVVATAALNDQVTSDDYGAVMGTLSVLGQPVSNLLYAFVVTSGLSNAIFSSTSAGGTVLNIDKNGDTKTLTPPFELMQPVHIFAPDGTPDVIANVTNISGTAITIDTPTTLTSGSLQHSLLAANDTTFRFYFDQRDVFVDGDSGGIDNITQADPSSAFQFPPVGNEIVETLVFYIPQNTKATRIPALDGIEQLDDGRLSRPQMKYGSESRYLALEATALDTFGVATVSPTTTTISGLPFSVAVGDTVRFINGPNANQDKVISAVSGVTATVTIPFTSLDTTGSNLVKVTIDGALPDILTKELGILVNNVAAPPVPLAIIGTLNAELPIVDQIIRDWGPVGQSGTGTASGAVLTDNSTDFSDVTTKYVLYVPSGPNQGVYEIKSKTTTTITVSTSSPFYAFPSSGPTQYIIIQKYSFLGTKGPQFMAGYFQKTLAFLSATEAWAAAPDPSGSVARQTLIAQRISDVTSFTKKIASILKNGDKLYDTRYLWIDQRINRKTGSLTQLKQAADTRVENLQKLLDDQQKLLIALALG